MGRVLVEDETRWILREGPRREAEPLTILIGRAGFRYERVSGRLAVIGYDEGTPSIIDHRAGCRVPGESKACYRGLSFNSIGPADGANRVPLR